MDIRSIVEAFLRVPTVWPLDISRDGKWGLFVSDEPGIWQLFSIKLDTGEVVQLTSGEDASSFGRISSSGKRVAFIRDVKGTEQHRICEVPIEGGKEEPLFDEPGHRIWHLSWSPDDLTIGFTAATAEANGLWLLDVGSRKAELSFRSQGWCFGPSWSRDGKRIGLNADTTRRPKSMELVLTPRDGEPRVFTPREGSFNMGCKFSHDSNRVLFSTNARGEYELAYLDVKTMSVNYFARSKEVGRDFTFFDWLPDGSACYLALREGRTRLYVETLDGGLREIPLPPGVHYSGGVSDDGSNMMLDWSSTDRPSTISILDLRTGELRDVYDTSRFLPDWARRRMGKASEFKYKSFDGLEIHGFMLTPSIWSPPYPAVLVAHGGPWAAYTDSWRPVWHALAACGYVVVGPNFRGSTGYGVSFQFMDIGDPGGGDLEDVVECRKWLETLPIVDPRRIAIMGGSYGGFMTNIAMTKRPGLWAAGVSIAGVSDWEEDYELSDAAFKSFDEWLFKGRPDEKRELYKDRSPINFVENLNAPLLLLHPVNDSRCPLKPIERFYRRLKELGKDVELGLYEEAGHISMKVKQIIDLYVRAIEFLNTKLSHRALES